MALSTTIVFAHLEDAPLILVRNSAALTARRSRRGFCRREEAPTTLSWQLAPKAAADAPLIDPIRGPEVVEAIEELMHLFLSSILWQTMHLKSGRYAKKGVCPRGEPPPPFLYELELRNQQLTQHSSSHHRQLYTNQETRTV